MRTTASLHCDNFSFVISEGHESILFAVFGIKRGGKVDRLFLRKLSSYDEFTHVDFRLYDGCRRKFAIHDDS